VRLDATAYGRDAFGQVVIARDFGEHWRRDCAIWRMSRAIGPRDSPAPTSTMERCA
jgi:hypothetical protein